ncbi:MAG TPA: glycosyltransferase [Dehalococcoidales bacterium]|nr:glycosyltransferase [Dehalococcoidales bacterium]
MIYQIVIAVGLALFLVNLILNFRTLKKPRRNAVVPNPAPLISVLVPARNEESNIRRCLESLRRQDYPNYEVLVLDDGSTDNTAEIVSEIAAKDRRIKLFKGEPLPGDWVGKTYACHQLAQKAAGSWLLFVDADTVHEPRMLRGVLELAMQKKVTLLSGFPRQLAGSLPLKIIQPVQYYIILGWLPVWLLHKLGKPSLAIGQFMFFNAQEYRRMGGHEAVRQEIVEDVSLGIEVGKHNGRHVAIDLSPVVSTEMYVDVGDAWRGFGKSIQGIVAMNPVGIVGLIIAATIFYIMPFWWLWRGFFVTGAPLLWRSVVLFQVCAMYAMHLMVDLRLREPLISVLFSPVGLAFYILNVMWATVRWAMGAGVSWKERVYGGQQAGK